MKRWLLVAIACSSCTFTHAYTHRRAPDPVVLSPKMAKLDRERRSPPLWAFVADQTLVVGGFVAGPVTQSEPINLAGLAVTGLVFASMAVALGAL